MAKEPLYPGGLAAVTRSMVNSILTVRILENRYFSKQKNRINLVRNASGLLTEDIKTISSQLGDSGMAMDFLVNSALCEQYLDVREGRLEIKKVQEVKDIIRPPPEESMITLAEKVLQRKGRVINGGFPGAVIDYGEVEISGKNLLIVRIGSNSSERWKVKSLRRHFRKFLNNRKRGDISGAAIILQPGAEVEELKIPVYYIQKSLRQITASIHTYQNHQDNKLEEIIIGRLSVLHRINYFLQ
ncbi:hypothetical protein GTN66_06385, partial [bacterium]|nr:hypothetical protein [bacterium]NIO74025.1 hypothetical protein [bacterium]